MKRSEAVDKIFDKVQSMFFQQDDRTWDLKKDYEKDLLDFIEKELGMLPPPENKEEFEQLCYQNDVYLQWNKE